jgi:hypothetical protein
MSLFAKLMDIPVQPTFSNTGNCHDLGHGNWKGAPGVVFLGDYWDLNYQPGARLYYSHQLDPDFRQQNPDVKFVGITVLPEDYPLITRLLVKKAWPDKWTPVEYNKWVGPDYPAYSCNNIAESDIICNDLIADLLVTLINPWFENNKNVAYDYTINFRTIMGLDSLVLDQCVSNIVGSPLTVELHKLVQTYQQLNQQLYFKSIIPQ